MTRLENAKKKLEDDFCEAIREHLQMNPINSDDNKKMKLYLNNYAEILIDLYEKESNE